MPRTLGAGVSPIPQLRSAEAVYLMEFQFSGGSIFLNTGSTDLLWNGNTWVAVGGAIDLDPLTETTDQQGQGLGIKLSGVDQSIIAAMLTNGHRGRLAKVWLAHIHRTTNLSANPELKTVSTGWSHLNGTYSSSARVTDHLPPYGGAAALKLTVIDTGNVGGNIGVIQRNGGTANANRILVTENQTYTISFSVDLTQYAGSTFRLRAVFYTSGGSQSGTVPESQFIAQIGWQRYSLTFTVPAGYDRFDPRMDNVTAGLPLGDMWISELKVDPGSIATEYEPGYAMAVQAGQVAIDPIQIGTYFMNEGFKVAESRDELGAGGTVEVSTRLVSRLAVLSKQRGLRTNVDSHQALFAGDLFFKFVPTLTHKRIKWGG